MSLYRFCSYSEFIKVFGFNLSWISFSRLLNLSLNLFIYYSFDLSNLLLSSGFTCLINWQMGYLPLLSGKIGLAYIRLSSSSSCTDSSTASPIIAQMFKFFSLRKVKAISSTLDNEQSLSSTFERMTAMMQIQSSGVKGWAARQSKTYKVFCLLRMSVMETRRSGWMIALRGQSSEFTFFYNFLNLLPKKLMIFLDELGQSSKSGRNQFTTKVSDISNAAIASSLKSITKGYIIPGSHCTVKSGQSRVKDETMKETCLSMVCQGRSGYGLVSYVKCW